MQGLQPAAPLFRPALRVKKDAQLAQVLCRPFGRDHEHGLAVRPLLHYRVGPCRHGLAGMHGPEIAVGMAAHDNVHAPHAAGKLAIPVQAQVGQGNDDVHAPGLKPAHDRLKCAARLGEVRVRTDACQGVYLVIGQADDGHLAAVHLEKTPGLPAGTHAVQGTVRARGQIGGKHHCAGFWKVAGKLFAPLVELVVAQGQGIPGHEGIETGLKGPAKDTEVEGALPLIACVQHKDMVGSCLYGLHARCQSCRAACARLLIIGGIAVPVPAGCMGMGVVGVQQDKLEGLPGLPAWRAVRLLLQDHRAGRSMGRCSRSGRDRVCRRKACGQADGQTDGQTQQQTGHRTGPDRNTGTAETRGRAQHERTSGLRQKDADHNKSDRKA